LRLCYGPRWRADDEFRVYTEHPRLILTAQRLRLLKRERERESQRWRQFDLLVKGSANLPEPGFALALYYAVSGTTQRASGRGVGAGPRDDLRQLALVYDWCQPCLAPSSPKRWPRRSASCFKNPAAPPVAARAIASWL
jgi:hypothetical protein